MASILRAVPFSVRNGTIRAFTQIGIQAESTYTAIDNMRVTGNFTDIGISTQSTPGNEAVITNTMSNDNAGFGIGCDVSVDCRIDGVQVSGNAIGISIANGSIVDSQINRNGTTGVQSSGSFVAMGDTLLSANGTNISGTVNALSPNRCGAVAC